MLEAKRRWSIAIVKPSARPRAESSGRGFDGLVLDVAGQRVVEVQLVAVDLELGGLHVALGEERS